MSRPTWKQALIMLASGVVLGIGSCAGFLSTLNINGSGSSTPSMIFAVIFLASVATFLLGIIYVIAAAFLEITKPLPAADLQPASQSVAQARTVAQAAPAFDSQRLRLALIVAIAVPAVPVLMRFATSPAGYKRFAVYGVIAYVFAVAPYAVALAGVQRPWRVIAVALALGYAAADVLHQAIYILTFVATIVRHVPLHLVLDSLFGLVIGLLAAAAVFWFALAIYRSLPLPSRQPATLLLMLVGSWVYLAFFRDFLVRTMAVWR